jgi:CheY-like chemotaxis protein
MDKDLKPVSILLVEDSPDDVEITRRALSRGQVKNNLLVARDGQEALDILFSRRDTDGALPGLILLDLNLPRVDGREVLEKIKSDPKLKRVPVIAMTSSTREEDVLRTYDLGVNTFISKPVKFEDFIRVIATIRDYWILIATLPPMEQV